MFGLVFGLLGLWAHLVVPLVFQDDPPLVSPLDQGCLVLASMARGFALECYARWLHLTGQLDLTLFLDQMRSQRPLGIMAHRTLREHTVYSLLMGPSI